MKLMLQQRKIANGNWCGKPNFTYPRVPEKGEKQWPFNRPFYFALSMQINNN